MLNAITWTVDPVLVHLGPLTIRWYGLMWGIGFFIGFEILRRMYKHENINPEWADKIFIYMFIGTLIGARLGHCLFYEPFDYIDKEGIFHQGFLNHPLNILKIWEGGLSSHGGAFGIMVSMYIFDKKVSKLGYVWIFDRLVIAVAFTGACIRFGNLMNSEIYGSPTNLPWGFEFIRDPDWHKAIIKGGSGELPVHPTQIYEMLYCLATLAVTAHLYWRNKAYEKRGLIFGVFLIMIFGTRFILEFIKNDQVAFERSMPINMGQILSLPFIIWGVWLLYRVYKQYGLKAIINKNKQI
jgi:prolipoprotein diacylglyceryl transferase